MNIFATSPCPKKSAEFLDSKRVIKMILESCQMLSTAMNECGGKGPYKSTHVNHPCSIWVRESIMNYLWLYDHFKWLHKEYRNRYGKNHKCFSYKDTLLYGAALMPAKPQTTFPNCTTYKEEVDVHIAYKKYLTDKWRNDKIKPKWEIVK